MCDALTKRLTTLSAPFKFVTLVNIHSRGESGTLAGFQSSATCLWNASTDGA